jgi:hypothetical protein
MKFWMYACYIYAFVTFACFFILTVIVTIGGIFDLKFLFKSLNQEVLDETDDGRVE